MILIINADDFALDEATNKGVVEAFKKGLCSSTTLMVNMPGFQEACQLVHENNLLKHVGIHLVLRDGYPLTEKIKYFPKFCSCDGQLCFSPKATFTYLGGSEKKALAEEIRAQIRRCREYGIPLTHLDTHYHQHLIWEIMSVLIPILKQEDIPYIRIKENTNPDIPFRFKVYTHIFNYRLKIMGLARTKYYGSIGQFLALRKKLNSLDAINSFSISVYPKINAQQMLIGRIYDKEVDLEKEVKQIDIYKDIVSYSGAKYL
ncbi:MAG: ChbG/HpnK family deacetylase [Candidatus Omnitrophota bacterium]|nr:ChbG/HpnK family deacetylase [Candidatus Omnitrophota bacterium]